MSKILNKENKSSWLFLLVKYPSCYALNRMNEWILFLMFFFLLCVYTHTHRVVVENAYAYTHSLGNFFSFCCFFFLCFFFSVFKLTVYTAFKDERIQDLNIKENEEEKNAHLMVISLGGNAMRLCERFWIFKSLCLTSVRDRVFVRMKEKKGTFQF